MVSRIKLSRRAVLKGVAASAFLPTTSFAADTTPLVTLAKEAGLMFGAAGHDEIFADSDYANLILRETGLFVPEIALKFDALRPDANTFSFDKADAQIRYCESHKKLVRGHTLLWNDWPPDWLKKTSSYDIPNILDRHIDTVVGRYAGRIQSWDVVNEPFHPALDRPGTYRHGAWYNALGEDYIFRAFQRAARADPKAKLVLNEAWTERSDTLGIAVRKGMLNLIDKMQSRGLKLDAIGLQSHLAPGTPADDDGFVAFLLEIQKRGLDIYLSEFDITDHTYVGTVFDRDKQVAERAYQFLTKALSVKAVKAVITWELADRYTWYRQPSVIDGMRLTRLARPLPFDDDLKPKPMRDAMARAFRERKV